MAAMVVTRVCMAGMSCLALSCSCSCSSLSSCLPPPSSSLTTKMAVCLSYNRAAYTQQVRTILSPNPEPKHTTCFASREAETGRQSHGSEKKTKPSRRYKCHVYRSKAMHKKEVGGGVCVCVAGCVRASCKSVCGGGGKECVQVRGRGR